MLTPNPVNVLVWAVREHCTVMGLTGGQIIVSKSDPPGSAQVLLHYLPVFGAHSVTDLDSLILVGARRVFIAVPFTFQSVLHLPASQLVNQCLTANH